MKLGVRSETFKIHQIFVMKIEKESTILVNSEERRMYYVAVRDEFFQNYITSSMEIVHYFFITTIDNTIIEIKSLGSSVITDVFHSFL